MHQEHLTWVHHSIHTRYHTTSNKLRTTRKINNNSFAEQNSKTPQQDTTAIIEQLRQLLLPQKNSTHQVNEVEAAMPQPGTTWDLKAAAKLPTAQEEQSK